MSCIDSLTLSPNNWVPKGVDLCPRFIVIHSPFLERGSFLRGKFSKEGVWKLVV
jgi:hypothetical protein